ncbi:MAG: NACHT domain-containing protein, partial [Oscillospiraceae bacterium]|nr:NACHT domain-containing protein [Oscillospiraceae bacterium]
LKNKYEIILLGPDEIVEELIQGKILCSLEKAIDVSASIKQNLKLCPYVDLIAHKDGWIWAIYYSAMPEQGATHFALVHADGNLLFKTIISDFRSHSMFSKLSYLNPPLKAKDNIKEARTAYYKYLENELGEIQFESMPTDKDAGAVKVNLENIFVPLSFEHTDEEELTDIRKVLEKSRKAAILAKPGGGKSTLIRRIALAYAYPERRLKVDDGLPDCNWFPIYIRCRDLGDNATKSIMEIISLVVTRAEIPKYGDGFNALTEMALQEGTALLLVDGLDEISNEKYRVCFADQLRTFVATYPNVHLIITSRVAGFRAVAGTLASYCEQYSIADFSEEQISSLSMKWHKAVMGDSGNPEEESDKVCNIIFSDRRILALAENPLLLTTLLFVKRWIGYLPTKKCQLYDEMIKLLLVTWNAVAHEKLDIEETEPQLAYIAYSMTLKGIQKITKDDLVFRINEVRKLLPELLSYTKVSAPTFINQVEERSSLLIQIGLEKNESGVLVHTYEFSHLSFQEYLTAKFIAEGWVNDLPIDVLKPHINKEHWKEVIPLTAVLMRRNAKEVVEYLLELSEKLICESSLDKPRNNKQLAPFHLANCIASEVSMNPELLEKAVIAITKCRDMIDEQRFGENSLGFFDILEIIIKSKYGDVFRETIENTIINGAYQNYLPEFVDTLADIQESLNKNKFNLTDILHLLEGDNLIDQVAGNFQMRLFSFENEQKFFISLKSEDNKNIERIFNIILKQLKTDDEVLIYSATWCIALSGYERSNIIPEAIVPLFARRLIELWINNSYLGELKEDISWGLFCIFAPCLQKNDFQDIEGLEITVKKNLESSENDYDFRAALNIAVLMEYLSKEEVYELLTRNRERIRYYSFKYLKSQDIDVDKILKQSASDFVIPESVEES